MAKAKKIPLHVALVWHQHQPHYRDLMTHEHVMPWVRLHATKDYLDMALILDEFPEMRMTINLVPSLVEQLEEFTQGEADDPWLTLVERPAEDLEPREKSLILQRLFSANFDTMIAPHPRYRELHRRRGWSSDPAEIERRVHLFRSGDWRDIQVWFQLAWTDPLLIERDPELRALVEKGEGFTEEEKLSLLAKQRAIIAEILPVHRRLQESGQLEVTTSPFYHPILPLLCDTDWAKQARPGIALPSRRHRHPEDADAQVREGLAFMAERMGAPPRGMWPSEGSVCPEVIPILARAGIEWIATDEEVLAKSLGIPPFTRDRRMRVNNMDALYRPYTIEVDGERMSMIFRDHELSDFIGFRAADQDPAEAAEALIDRLRDIHAHLNSTGDPHLVSIILDGENCWEFYRDDGLPFLRALYGGLCEDPDLAPTRVSDFLDAHPPTHSLSNLHAGSWINHDFCIWIGHAEDNQAWDYLSQTRDRVMEEIENNTALSEEQIALAKKALMIAQGSDWNWWYGDDHSSGNDALFDDLYRRHIAAAHRAVGLEPPAALQMPITSAGIIGELTHPRGYVDVVVDGRETHFFEWTAAGHCDPLHGGGAMHRAEETIRALLFGFSPGHLALRVDLVSSIWDRVGREAVTVEFILHEPQALRLSATLPLRGERGDVAMVLRPLDANGDPPLPCDCEAAWDRILEVLVPWEALGAKPGDRLLLQAAVLAGGEGLDRAPARAPILTQVPDEEWEASHWVV